ncbi:MAG: Serine--tRNA ligase [Chlamydiia bacterium]|nr:Serine--tRNA ligase [Chlamydiia bacterium]
MIGGMLDIKLLESDPKTFETRLRSKDKGASLDRALELHKDVRKIRIRLEELQAESNRAAKEIGAKKRAGEDVTEVLEKVEGLKGEIGELKGLLRSKSEAFEHEMAMLPNLPEEGVRVSYDPAENEVVAEWGELPKFDFEVKSHIDIAKGLGIIDFERGVKVSRSGFVVYRGMGARLEWALLQWMIDYHVGNGFEMIIPPLLTSSEMLYNAAQFPKFKDQVFHIHDEHFDLCLIPTSEVILNGLHADEILHEGMLPKRFVAMTPCFRREAGGYGHENRGMIRTHQFNKVEMFAFAKEDESDQVQEEFRRHAEKLLEELGLHYRTTNLVTGDMSFAAQKTYDIEAYLPGQGHYMEVSSVSNCGDFQARRSKARYKNGEGKMTLCHTLNGSGLATSRVMVALLETYQQADGSVLVPEVLQKYVGTDRISMEKK